jgi:hypothetical protein
VRYPLTPEALDGRPILLILVPRDAPHAHFLAGVARWTDRGLLVEHGPSATSIELRGTAEALAGFDPAALPRIVVPERYPAVARLADGVHACVAVFSGEEPAGAVRLECPFFGLGGNMETGEVLLFQDVASQESAEEAWADEDDLPPWAGEPGPR